MIWANTPALYSIHLPSIEIAGTVFQLPNDPDVLCALDAYEEFDPDAPGSSLFLRVLHPVALTKGGTLQCWIYVYNLNHNSGNPLVP